MDPPAVFEPYDMSGPAELLLSVLYNHVFHPTLKLSYIECTRTMTFLAQIHAGNIYINYVIYPASLKTILG